MRPPMDMTIAARAVPAGRRIICGRCGRRVGPGERYHAVYVQRDPYLICEDECAPTLRDAIRDWIKRQRTGTGAANS